MLSHCIVQTVEANLVFQRGSLLVILLLILFYIFLSPFVHLCYRTIYSLDIISHSVWLWLPVAFYIFIKKMFEPILCIDKFELDEGGLLLKCYRRILQLENFRSV